MKLRLLSKKLLLTLVTVFTLSLVSTTTTLAHVTVQPREVTTATYQVFTVSVPNEKNIPTISVRILIPKNVTNVTPTQKGNWKISTEKEGSTEHDTVKSITWSGSEIAKGFRDEFSFSAKTPHSPSELEWKAYQTYSDGTTVSWDQKESKEEHGSNDSGPFSITNVTNTTHNDMDEMSKKSIDDAQANADRALYVGVAGVAVGLIGVFFATRKK